MQDMNGGGHGMDPMTAPPPYGMNMNGTGHEMMMMMHMTFFWGKNSEILFSGWPGTRGSMYALALIFVFALGVLVEWLSHCRLLAFPAKPRNDLAAGVLQTLVHAVRLGLAYLVMLALMSFNAGVLLAAVVGHALGFLVFGSRAFRKGGTNLYQKSSERAPMSC